MGPPLVLESKLSFLALAALVLALVALARTGAGGDLAVRVKRLEEEIERLRRALVAGPAAAPAAHQPAEAAAPPGTEQLPAAGREAREGLLREPPQGVAVPEPLGAGAPGTVPPAAPGPVRMPDPEAAPPPFFAQIDWERWLGVRGAAVLGGTALALAGLFFFRYSIEHGLIPPWLRVVLGVLTGVAALAGAEWSLRRRYAGTANALAGGGLVVLYAAFWAAGALYELIPTGAVFALMVVVTITGCALSWRHESLVIAVIGLVGGFLTPVFASSGADRPLGLFGYVLLLDVGVLLLARSRSWPVLGLLALAATSLYQVLWIGTRMDAERTLLGLAILAVFALLFVLATPREAGASSSRAWRWSQRGAVLVPLATALYFAGESSLEVGLLPLGALLAVLGVAAGWLARQHGEGRLALGAAAATLGVVVAWLADRTDLDGAPWTAALVFVALAAAHHVALEMARAAGRRSGSPRPRDGEEPAAAFEPLSNAAALLGLGLLALLVLVGGAERVALWPLLAGWLGIAALLLRQGTLDGRGPMQVAAAVGVACGLALHRLAQHTPAEDPLGAGTTLALPVTLLVAVAWQGIALWQAKLASHRHAEHAAAALALVLLLSFLPEPLDGPLVGLGTPLLLGALAALAATRLGGGPWLLVAVAATALVQLAWTMDRHPVPSVAGLALGLASSAAFAAWPLAVAARLRADAWAWRASALSGVLFLPALLVLFEDGFGDAAIGALPLALAVVAVAVAARARDLWPADDPRRTSALAWLCGAALGFVTLAIPLQVEKEWITIGWALEGAALVALWTRLDHPGLKYVALALLGAVTVRLVANAEVIAYYPRPAWRVVNWITYTYLVPAAAMVWAARLLAALEVERLRPWERRVYPRERALGAGAVGLAALVAIFAWINLTIADWFSPGDRLRLVAARTPAEKLTLSIAWALYAVALLALGVRLRSGALRWASLVLLMVTIGKIFLYDVGQLSDLYRVGALLGLALSLIVVSLVYQRFVFRRPAEESP